MYMLRAYQSPCSTPDCGPQCDQIPHFASPYQAGISYFWSDSWVPANGPSVSGSETGAGDAPDCPSRPEGFKVVAAKRAIARRLLRITFAISIFIGPI